jgi:tRNA (guanosine-2'-O-)-methyltransferase
LRKQGFKIVATSLEAERTLEQLDFSQPMALCFGNELDGVTDELFGLADETFKIPMYGFTQSFNLSVALSLCMHTASNARRRFLGSLTDLKPNETKELRDVWIRRACKNTRRIERALSVQSK